MHLCASDFFLLGFSDHLNKMEFDFKSLNSVILDRNVGLSGKILVTSNFVEVLGRKHVYKFNTRGIPTIEFEVLGLSIEKQFFDFLKKLGGVIYDHIDKYDAFDYIICSRAIDFNADCKVRKRSVVTKLNSIAASGSYKSNPADYNFIFDQLINAGTRKFINELKTTTRLVFFVFYSFQGNWTCAIYRMRFTKMPERVTNPKLESEEVSASEVPVSSRKSSSSSRRSRYQIS